MAYSINAKDYFNTKLWTGNGSAGNAQTGVGFQPDLVWTKGRSNAYDNTLTDAVRSATKYLISNSTNAEATGNIVTSFDSDGFTLGDRGEANNNSSTYVAWNWKAGNSAGSANTDGSINSTVSVNTTAGFSIVKWTGDGTKAATVGHGLGVKPAWIIARDYAQAKHWFVYHQELTDNYVMTLNSSDAEKTGNVHWGSGSLMKSASSPTTTTFSFNGSGSSITNINGNSYTNIAYCFAEKTGFSKFGKYTGNGNANGPFIYTGFKPAFVMYKNITDNATNWQIHDSARSPGNLSVNRLNPNDSSVEVTTTGDSFDLLSNGFKARGTGSNSNTSAKTYIYMAFAAAPLVGTNNIPATAR